MKKNNPHFVLILAFALTVVVAAHPHALAIAQLDSDSAPRYSEPEKVYYEIGLKITSNGKATGVIGTVPIPINWPEQHVTIVKENKTENLRKFNYKDLTKETRQLILRANRLSAGETAQGSVVLLIEKRELIAPKNVEKLVLAKKIPGKVKTYLKPSPYIESKHKRIKKIAKTVAIDSELAAWEQVEAIYKWVRENIRYEFDTQIHSCLEALDSGHGDCEELSSLFIAICRAKGIPARAVWIPSHTYPEFYLHDESGKGHWFPCQAAGTYEFGAMTELKPVLQKGDRFKVPGSREMLRYVRPTLVAKDAPRGLSIEFINRHITDAAEIEQLESISAGR